MEIQTEMPSDELTQVMQPSVEEIDSSPQPASPTLSPLDAAQLHAWAVPPREGPVPLMMVCSPENAKIHDCARCLMPAPCESWERNLQMYHRIGGTPVDRGVEFLTISSMRAKALCTPSSPEDRFMKSIFKSGPEKNPSFIIKIPATPEPPPPAKVTLLPPLNNSASSGSAISLDACATQIFNLFMDSASIPSDFRFFRKQVDPISDDI
ncbi:hypothetical protein BGZ54_002874 [Gamsiella multidivaricata]|nr:hypothetical protein BGZ54_002874 [Gamsiella multidivaricata]